MTMTSTTKDQPHLESSGNKAQALECGDGGQGVGPQETEMTAAVYDFDKYEMMSTSCQMRQLLSQKQDTPKGSSASEDGDEH